MALFEKIGGFFPKELRKDLQKELAYAGIETDAKKFTGLIVLMVLSTSISFSIVLSVVLSFPQFLLSMVIAIAEFALVFYWLKMKTQSKVNEAEAMLPDALELVASNIRAGMTTERALFEAAREEFGVLSKELRAAGKKIVAGQRMDSALSEIPDKIDSPLLRKTIDLLIQGIKSGGQITDLLFQISDSIREENAIREEIGANISMYVMMIFITAAFGAPVLFGISSYIVGIVNEQSNQEIPSELLENANTGVTGRITSLAVGQQGEKISEGFIVLFSEIALVLTAVFSALTIGVIRTGDEINGVKYMPAILVISLSLFLIARYLLAQMIGSIAFL